MSTHYSSAWGTTLRYQGLRRQLKQESSGVPLPGFFQKKFQGFPGGQVGPQSQEESSFSDGAAVPRSSQSSHRMSPPRSKVEHKLAPPPSPISSLADVVEGEASHFYGEDPSYGVYRRMDGRSGRSFVLSFPSLKKFLPFSSHRRRGDASGDPSEALSSFRASEIVFSMNKGSLIALIFSLLCLVLFSMSIGFFFGISISGGPTPAPTHVPNHVSTGVVSTPPPAVASQVDVPAVLVAAAPVVRRPVAQHSTQQVKKEGVVRTLPVDMDTAAFSRPYSLQVGEFSQKESAQKWVNVLRKRGYDAYLVARYEGKNAAPSYAVRMGGYYTKQAASTAAQYLKNSERFKTISIARNQAEVIS